MIFNFNERCGQFEASQGMSLVARGVPRRRSLRRWLSLAPIAVGLISPRDTWAQETEPKFVPEAPRESTAPPAVKRDAGGSNESEAVREAPTDPKVPATAAPNETAITTPSDNAATASKARAPNTHRDSSTEITVAGTRLARTAGSAHVIRSKDLERFQYDDPHAVLRAVPGVYSRGEDGMGLRPNIGIRGVNPDRSKKITLMEDGVLVSPASYSAPAAYYFPLMGRMERVFVIKGPGAISHGPQTVGGAVNLVTRAIPTSTSGMIDVGAGEYGYNKLHGYVGSSDGQTGYLIEGVHLGSSGFKELPNGADTGFYRNEWMFKGRYAFDPNARATNELLLKLTYSDEVSNETYLGLSNADFHENPLARYGASKLDRMKNYRTGISLTHVYAPSSKLMVTTTAYRSDFSRVWRKVNGFRGASLFDVLRAPRDPRNAVFAAVISGRADSGSSAETLLVGPNARDFVSQGVETRVRWDVSTGPISHRVEYGARLHHDRVERRHSEDPFRLLGGELVPEGGPTVVTAFNEAWTEAFALHAADAMTWANLTVTPGVRVEMMRSGFVDRSARTEQRALTNVILPGGGIFYALTDAFGVLGGVYRGFSPPEPGAAKRVKPELSWNYEGGARYADHHLRAEAIAFYNDYSNITDICTLSSGCVDANLDRQYDGGKARIYGAEAFVQHAPTFGEITVPITASYTFTRAEFSTSFSSEDPIFGNVAKGDEMPYIPRHQGGGSIGVETRYGGGAIGASYVAAMREEAGSEPLSSTLATDSLMLFDVSANVRVWKAFVVYANVRNLLNEQVIVSHRPFGARPNAPRWVQAGIKATF